MQDKKGGFWFTTKTGKHVHVEDGETPKQAAERAFKGKQSQSDNKVSLSYEPETKDADIKGEDFFAEPETPKKQVLAIEGEAAENLFDDIRNKEKRYTYEELLANPAIQELEKKAQRAQELASKKPPLSDEDKVKYSEQFLKGAKNTPKQFRADIVMGLPAAGKSSAVVNSLKDKYGSFEFDNDEIKKLLPGYNEYGAAYVHADSKAVQKHALKSFGKDGEFNGANLAIPIIGDTVDKVNDYWIKNLQTAGYDIHIHHVGISNEESLNRSVARAIEHGRYVPLETIKGYGEKPKSVYEQLKREDRKGVVFE
jgi:hypothetical protein